VVTVNRGLVAAAILCVLTGWSSTADADWAACQGKPTRACLLEEAWRGDNGPLAGKDRLDVLILTDFRNHPEYLTAADIEEAKRQVTSQPVSPTATRLFYFALAATGLVAANRVQEAFDLMPSLDVGMRNAALNELTVALIKADALDEVPIFGRRMLADPRSVFDTAVKTLADQGKIEQALAFMAVNPTVLPDEKEMLVAVGVAYALRGEPKMAARFYDKAQSILELQQPSAVQDDVSMQLRLVRISLQALRGDTDGAEAALQQLPAVSDKPSDRGVEINRSLGYQKLIVFLLRTGRFDIALDVAKSAPERFRAYSLVSVAGWDAGHGRLDDAHAILSLMGDNPKARGAVLRALAIATAKSNAESNAKSGDITSAVALASQTSDPTSRRATLFEVAQTLRP
jgi:tetratricopeptide (TPR) repeat protein